MKNKTYRLSQALLDGVGDDCVLGGIYDKLVKEGFIMTYARESFEHVFQQKPVRCLHGVTITLKNLQDLVHLIGNVGRIVVNDSKAPEEYDYPRCVDSYPQNTIVIYDDYIE